MRWPSAARKYVDIPVRFFDRRNRPLVVLSLDVVALPRGTKLGPATAWTPVAVVDNVATIYLYGPDSGGPAVGVTAPAIFVPADGLDLYIRPTDPVESDPVYVDRVTLT